MPDARAEDRWFDAEQIHRSQLRSVLTIPLLVEAEAIGVVGLDSPRFTAHTPSGRSDLARLRAIAAICRRPKSATLARSKPSKSTGHGWNICCGSAPLRTEVSDLRKQLREAHSLDTMVGQSPEFREVLAQVELVAPADSTVLLIGETGTGRELIARASGDSTDTPPCVQA